MRRPYELPVPWRLRLKALFSARTRYDLSVIRESYRHHFFTAQVACQVLPFEVACGRKQEVERFQNEILRAKRRMRGELELIDKINKGN